MQVEQGAHILAVKQNSVILNSEKKLQRTGTLGEKQLVSDQNSLSNLNVYDSGVLEGVRLRGELTGDVISRDMKRPKKKDNKKKDLADEIPKGTISTRTLRPREKVFEPVPGKDPADFLVNSVQDVVPTYGVRMKKGGSKSPRKHETNPASS